MPPIISNNNDFIRVIIYLTLIVFSVEKIIILIDPMHHGMNGRNFFGSTISNIDSIFKNNIIYYHINYSFNCKTILDNKGAYFLTVGIEPADLEA